MQVKDASLLFAKLDTYLSNLLIKCYFKGSSNIDHTFYAN